MHRPYLLTILLALSVACGTAEAAPTPAPVAKLVTDQPDADRDGIPDTVELVLGMDARRRDVMYHVHHDQTIAEGERVHSRRKKVPDLADFYFGNVAGNRWVWRIDFADQFEGVGANLLLYVDADNDPATGRQGGATGTDVRLMYYNGSFTTVVRNSRVMARDRGLRGVATGHSLYFCIDLNFHTDATGNSHFRARALCQMSAEPYDSDSAEWFTIVGPGMQDLPKRPVGVLSQVLSERSIVQKPWLGWRGSLRALKPVTLDHRDAKIEGMKPFNRALEPIAERATATWASPVAGKYHVNVLIQDSGVGREEVHVRVDNEEVARFVAGQNDGDLYLFTTEQPAPFERETSLTLAATAPAQDFRLCEVFLTPEPVRPGPLKITHLETYCDTGADGRVDVDVCFLTDYSCLASVRWGKPGRLDGRLDETQATYNHRVRLTGLDRGTQYAVQAFASDGEDTAKSSVLSFTAEPKRMVRGSASLKRISLSVKDMMEQGRPTWPVNGGVPIPRGELSSADKCRLVDASGNAVPAQFTELGHWPGGSVKWVLVSLTHAPGRGSYTLEYGEDVRQPSPPANGIRVTPTDDGLRVVTDLLKVELSRTRFAPPGAVWLNADGRSKQIVRGDGEGVVLIDSEGNRYTSSSAPATHLGVEEAGPVRTVILAEGPFSGAKGKKLSYRCRLYFYRGFAGVPVVFQLLADEGKTIFPPTLHRIRSITLPTKLTGNADGTRGRWLQDDAQHFVVEDGSGRTGHDGTAPGAKAVRVRGTPVAVAVRDFWQLYPKALSFDGSTLTAEVFPELPPKQYAEHTDPKLLTMNYYWFRDGAYLVPCGTAASTDLLFTFGLSDAEAVEQAWQQRVLLAPSPEHYCRSGALFDLEPEKPGVFERFQAFVRDGFEKVEKRRRQQRWYSWMNYGDWYGERGVNWGNQEYDMQWGLLLQYLRSGEMRFFHRGETAAMHTSCIDQITWSPSAQHLGIQKEHALWHTGGFDTPRVEGAKYWFKNGIYNTGHMWSLGTYAAYWLTGDRRFKHAMDGLCDWMAGQYCQRIERWLHRNYGWSTLVVLGAYHTEPHPYYLNAARLFMDVVVSKRDPGTGAFVHPIGECTHWPRHMGGKTFMSGVVISALRLMDQIEPSDDYKAAILDTCDWMYRRMWYPDQHGFQYAECPGYDNRGYTWGVTMPCGGLAYAYELTKKPKYSQMLVQPLSKMVTPTGGSASGKGYATQIRMTPYAFSAMERWGMRELPPLPPSRPRLVMPSQLYLAPGEPARLTVIADNEQHAALEAKLEIARLPKGLKSVRQRVSWTIRSGVSSSPTFRITGAAPDGEEVTVRYEIAQWRGELTATVCNSRPLKLGAEVGYVGGKEDPVGLALQSLGAELKPVPDLRPETLSRCRALLVGSEAHEKGFAGLPRNAHRLLDFVRSGGRVVMAQMQDSSFQPSYLPYPLTLSNDKGALKQIVAIDHPIFTKPHRIPSLEGLVSYDTITSADRTWRVLATDTKGQPSIVEATFGKGRILLIQPSPDRYVIGREQTQGRLTTEACAMFMRNIVTYLAASPR